MIEPRLLILFGPGEGGANIVVQFGAVILRPIEEERLTVLLVD